MTHDADRRAVAIAGHTGDEAAARAGLESDRPGVRATALGALERLGRLLDEQLAGSLRDPDAAVRRRAAEIAAAHPGIDLVPALHDPDTHVVETAAWACGEHESNRTAVVARLIELGAGADDALVREAAVAALGAIGDPAAVDVIVAAATTDKPAVRRRAVLALAPFLGDRPDVDATLERALSDRDWQVRQAAEDLQRSDR